MAVLENVNGKVWLALRARLEDFYECDIHWPMEPTGAAPESSKPYLYIEPVPLNVGEETLDYDCGEDHRGFINVRVYTPMGWDYAAASGLLGRVAALFPAGWQGFYDDLSVLVYRKPKADSSPFLEAGHNRQDLRIDWRAWG